MLNLLLRGGWVMYPILLASIIAVAIAAERIVQYIITRNKRKDILEYVTAKVTSGNIQEAVEYAETGRSHLDKVTAAYLRNYNETRTVLEENLHVTATGEIHRLEKHLSVLSLIANLATMMGLLGTVIGMILVFSEIAAQEGQAEMSHLAGGIWQALLTTAFGLIVAVPVMAVHHFLQKHVDKCIDDIETQISKLNILFKRKTAIGLEEIEEEYTEDSDEDDISTDTARFTSGRVY
ncbi:MAG: MotA/TolQ/ExbB proton channel family protein [Spirochaetes bacterium]|nr:MotA/TolQ/ExbB proton channel family protein [Spirochaetota bacterium]